MSEKDQEQFMKDTPLDGTPHFDVAAPAFVPKEDAEEWVVPEASGLSVTETKAMKEVGSTSQLYQKLWSIQKQMKQLLEKIQM